jgi:hypothetical protein
VDDFLTLAELIEQLDLRERESTELDRAARAGEIEFRFQSAPIDGSHAVLPNAFTTSNYIKQYSLPSVQQWVEKTRRTHG